MQLPPLSEVVDRALAQDNRRFETLLTAMYIDADAAREAFYARASTAGAQKAGKEMSDAPDSYGALKDPSPSRIVAKEAGFVGAVSHMLRHERNAETIATVLNERFFQGACTVFEDAGRMFRHWRTAVDANGIHSAAAQLASNPSSFGALRENIDTGRSHGSTPPASPFGRALASRGFDAEVARAHSASVSRDVAAPARPLLPRTLEELTNREGGRLPRPLELKLKGFAADYRGMLARAYRDPERADAAFHSLVGREGLQGAVLGVRREPTLLGPLTDAPEAAELAYGAAKRGARAYELHEIRNPTQAAEAVQRDAERMLARQVANPDEALRRVQVAMRRYGVDRVAEEIQREPQRYFTPRDDRAFAPHALAAQARGIGEANRAADEYVAAEVRRQNPERAVVSPTAAAAAAVEAHAEATRLQEKKGDLHEVLNNAANAARRAEDAVKWHGIYQSQFHRKISRIFANPAAAEKAFLEAADKDGYAAAIDQLTKKPQKLGTLARDRATAKDTASTAGGVAFSYLTARESLGAVEWRDRDGVVHQGVESVRATTADELKKSATELAATETRMHEIGGVDATRERAVERVQGLSAAQADELIAALKSLHPDAAQPIQGVRDTAAARRESMLPHSVIQTAQTMRSMAEGPTM
jgi:hypothetical protein